METKLKTKNNDLKFVKDLVDKMYKDKTQSFDIDINLKIKRPSEEAIY